MTASSRRLIHLSYDSPRNPRSGGGGALRDWEITSRFDPSWQTELWSGAFPGCDRSLHEGPAVKWLGSRSAGALGARLAYSLRAHLALRRFLSSEDLSETVISASPSVFAPVPALLDRPERTVLIIHHLVDAGDACRKYGPLGLGSIRHQNALLRRGRHYVTVNRHVTDRIRALNPDADITLIPNGIDETLLSLPRHPDPHPTVLFLGRFDREMKGLDRLLAAFGLLSMRLPEARLILAGRADERSLGDILCRCRKLPTEGRIEILPNVDETQKRTLLSRAWVFCSPSRFEGWCIAGVEAQASGLPVVASTADGFLDSVRDGKTGILVPNEQRTIVADLAAVLETLLTDENRREAMGAEARRWAGNFLWEALAAKQERLCETILEKNVGHP